MSEDEIKNEHNTAYIPLAKHRRQMIRIAVIGVLVLIGLICFALFAWYRLYSGGRLALREAKNIRLAVTAVDIEAYAAGASVYAPDRAEGLAVGVHDKIEYLADINGDFRLTGYDKKNHEVTGMTYRTKRYLVTFFKDTNGKETWTVDYMFKILDY